MHFSHVVLLSLLLYFTVQGKKAELQDLNNLVTPDYAVAWKEIGRELGIRIGILNAIEKNHADDCETCCDKMLEECCET